MRIKLILALLVLPVCALEAYLAKPEKDRLINEMKMTTAIYLKSSYLRENALGKMQHIPINIGIAVKGLEYQ